MNNLGLNVLVENDFYFQGIFELRTFYTLNFE